MNGLAANKLRRAYLKTAPNAESYQFCAGKEWSLFNNSPKTFSRHTFSIRSHWLSYDSDFRVIVPLHCFPKRVERNQHMVQNHGPRSLASSLDHSFVRSFARSSVNSRGVDNSDFGHSVPETIASSRRIFLDERKRYSCVSRVVLSGAHVSRSSQRLWRRQCLKHKNVLH